MTQSGLPFEAEKLSVKQLTAKLKRTLRDNFAYLIVRGEISGLKVAASGHAYFNLKEEDAILPSVMYRQSARLLKFPLKDGALVEARGSIDIYEPRGAYQFLVEFMEPVGIGALQQAFDELKRKLAGEGLFEQTRKRPLPKFPRRIGIVTSPSGAVIQDMLNIFERRSPGLEIRVFPALVQGSGSVEQICAGLAYFSTEAWADLVILARGGGSLEDLWSFNEEAVARAIVASSIPVVSAVGHETDFTIADFVSDLRAPTPSAAAELAVPSLEALCERIEGFERSLERSLQFKIARLRETASRLGIDRPYAIIQRQLNTLLQNIDDAESAMLEFLQHCLKEVQAGAELLDRKLREAEPLYRAAQLAKQWEAATYLLDNTMSLTLARCRVNFQVCDAQLKILSPLATLERGYAIVRDSTGKTVRDPRAVKPRSKLRIDVALGQIQATVAATRDDNSELPS
jgi:exodeoxyribonuclease VII large subunit